MKDRTGGLGKFLNEMTQVSEKNDEEAKNDPDQIVYIDIEKIESNPRNFYGLRDIEGLAGLIAVSRMIEPLVVRQEENGKYMLISGHRRCAAVQKLLEEGTYDNRMLPCIVKPMKKIKIEEENGETIEFDEEAVEMLNLIASNRGQREERTIDEKLQEVKYLESFAKAVYHQKDRGSRGRFRTFFAEEILNISTTQLQRMNSMNKLTKDVRMAINDGEISESAALELVKLSPKEQDQYISKIKSGEKSRKKEDIKKENAAKKSKQAFSRDMTVDKIIDVPEIFEDPQKEAQKWLYQEQLRFYQMKYEEAKRMKENEKNELKSAQWGIRASMVLDYVKNLSKV